jgi:histidinol-phosphate/aromatic aminotransferase/cobyric acid decarboxylase-like protein
MRMSLSRRDLLAASALLLAGPGAALRAGATDAPPGGKPLVLCWNENPYGPSPAARRAVSRSIADGCRYPSDAELKELVAALAQREGVGSDHIVTGTGSGELLCALGFVCRHDGGEIVAADPTYEELTGYARRRGATLKFVPVDAHLRHDLPAMHAAISARTHAVYLCNPNNPTGTALPAGEIRAFVRSLPPAVTVIVDEAYMDFASASGVGSVADLCRAREPRRSRIPQRLQAARAGEPHAHYRRAGTPAAALRRATGQLRVLRYRHAARAVPGADARARDPRRPAFRAL